MADDPVVARLEKLYKHFNYLATFSKYGYYVVKVSQVALAASIPVVALVDKNPSSPTVTAVIGSAILVMQGIQQTSQWHKKWVQSRVAARTLESEKSLYLSKAGPYRGLDPEEASVTLAERVESLADVENERWRALIEASFQTDASSQRAQKSRNNGGQIRKKQNSEI